MSETDIAASPSTGRIVRNAATAVAIAWSMRAIGLVSVLVLARVLTPRDFGIMALAMSAAALVDIFAALGLRQSLLRIREPERAHYDTAWTIQLLLLLILAGVLVAVEFGLHRDDVRVYLRALPLPSRQRPDAGPVE